MNNNRAELSIKQRVASQSELDALTCPICRFLMTAPVKQSSSETTGTCPQCRIPISNGGLSNLLLADHYLSHLRVDSLVNQFRYNQENKEWEKDARGCQEIVTVEISKDHKLICKFNPVKCKHQGCDVEVLKEDMDSHLVLISFLLIGIYIVQDDYPYLLCTILLCDFRPNIPCPYSDVGDDRYRSPQQELKECKQSIRETNKKQSMIKFEWVIDEYLDNSDYFDMGGFNWFLNAREEENEDIGFYLYLDHNHQKKRVKVDFTLEVQFPRQPLYTQKKDSIVHVYKKGCSGYGILTDSHINDLNQNDSVIVTFKGQVLSSKDKK
ncbi:hypothetical protein DFA_01912 [Cavenderia fasciculata]|uniref:MATH domain-containing protein n=1 Tax=Cavenderia fasciculata TaxID=261658 RepID=F4PQR5_CACFS|nr:uncharacterized protein DFA_01912 [Cavenderia fasciculata]EGG22023.1 hypothetical protein DFA_01912 [Cavenderia fasciculata]|eukprot:XP_004359874.1 hypothetical protein DFA_01912 [Cavenderia fasciculata]